MKTANLFPRRHGALRSILGLVVLLSVLIAPAVEAGPLSPRERLEVFDEVWSTIDEKYYDPSFNGVDWKAVRLRYLSRLDGVTDDAELYELITRMVTELHDANTRFRGPRKRQAREQWVATRTGLSYREIEGALVVTGVDPGSPAARSGVEPGMIVRTVDGRPFAERLAQALREIEPESSKRYTRWKACTRALGGKLGTSLTLGLARADGSLLTVTLPRRTVSARPEFSVRTLPSGVVYIQFDYLLPPVVSQLREALAEKGNAPGVILDLRVNHGGAMREIRRLAGLFFNREVAAGRSLTRGAVPVAEEFSAGSKGGRLYGGPLVVLTSTMTTSGAEVLTNLLQEKRRALILGTQTCGCALGILGHRTIKGGGELDVSEVGFVSAQGHKIEGLGVMPDMIVIPRISDVRRQRDAALEAAERYLAGAQAGAQITAPL
jgi:carboxyl-terminal processing protease